MSSYVYLQSGEKEAIARCVFDVVEQRVKVRVASSLYKTLTWGGGAAVIALGAYFCYRRIRALEQALLDLKSTTVTHKLPETQQPTTTPY